MSLFTGLKVRLQKQTPRWLVLLIDVHFTVLSFILALAIVWKSNWSFGLQNSAIIALAVCLTYAVSYLVFKSYTGIIRHTGLREIVNVLKATSAALLLLFLMLIFIQDPYIDENFTLVVLHYLITTITLVFLRVLYKNAYARLVQPHSGKKNLLIYGAGNSGIITYNALMAERNVNNVVYAFIDDNPKLYRSRIDGVKVIAPKEVTKELMAKENIEEVIISIQNIALEDFNKIVDTFEDFPVKLKIVPPLNNWIDGKLEAKEIQEIRIEDLLGRKSIRLEKDSIRKEVEGKVVLVTGAAGSIGSEISRQLLHYNCKKVILLDQAETALYELKLSCVASIKKTQANVKFIVGDVRDYNRVNAIFKGLRPDLVFHAAAYKHVPLMEENPYEAIATNIKGTKHVVDAAAKYGVSKFVMVSTDKVVNPTNVMGATKRVAELYVNHFTQKQSDTNYVITRFGNVLGSNGSVIPLFRSQLAEGGPLTVTHPEVTRYFMTIPEACQLVLEAGAMAKGGEIFVFDMGSPIKILDLAKRMIQLSGLNYPTDIDIEITGLRLGEKIYEELLADGENTKPTHHEKIMIARVRENTIPEFDDIINNLINLTHSNQKMLNLKLVGMLKELVPEYKSNNSIFESLDQSKVNDSLSQVPVML